MNVVIWLSADTWEGCIDHARRLLPADAEITLLHVGSGESEALALAAASALLARRRPTPEGPSLYEIDDREAQALLEAAAARLGRPARTVMRRGIIEREVVAISSDADLLVLARNGDPHRFGPPSLAHPVRFVVDHARCPVLVVWPETPPALDTLPPPPPHHHPPAKKPHEHGPPAKKPPHEHGPPAKKPPHQHGPPAKKPHEW